MALQSFLQHPPTPVPARDFFLCPSPTSLLIFPPLTLPPLSLWRQHLYHSTSPSSHSPICPFVFTNSYAPFNRSLFLQFCLQPRAAKERKGNRRRPKERNEEKRRQKQFNGKRKSESGPLQCWQERVKRAVLRKNLPDPQEQIGSAIRKKAQHGGSIRNAQEGPLLTPSDCLKSVDQESVVTEAPTQPNERTNDRASERTNE